MRRLPEGISAVLPAFNEVRVIASTVRRTHAALAASGVPAFEIIVVDDGSTDGTCAAVAAVATELSGVRCLRHEQNRGYGAALKTGFEAALNEAIFLMDSDGQFDPAELRLLVEQWDLHTVVCGYRAQRSDPLTRRLSNRAFFAIVNARFGRTARDVNCAFKLFPRTLGQGLTSEGAVISTELLFRARESAYTVVDVPVSHGPRLTGTATGANPKVVLRAFRELWALDRHVHRARERGPATPDSARR